MHLHVKVPLQQRWLWKKENFVGDFQVLHSKIQQDTLHLQVHSLQKDTLQTLTIVLHHKDSLYTKPLQKKLKRYTLLQTTDSVQPIWFAPAYTLPPSPVKKTLQTIIFIVALVLLLLLLLPKLKKLWKRFLVWYRYRKLLKQLHAIAQLSTHQWISAINRLWKQLLTQEDGCCYLAITLEETKGKFLPELLKTLLKKEYLLYFRNGFISEEERRILHHRFESFLKERLKQRLHALR